MTFVRILFAVLIAVFALYDLTGYAQEVLVPAQTPPQEPGEAAPPQDYVLEIGDVLGVAVYGEEELSQEYKIDDRGMFSMPLIGDIAAAGKSARQVQQEIVRKLEDGYLVNPSVTVDIARLEPFYIMGEVRSPGSYEYKSHLTVLNAVALAGGFTYRADREEVDIRRKTGEDLKTLYKALPVHTVIKPGDIIVVDERLF